MTQSVIASEVASGAGPSGILQRWASKAVRARLETLTAGEITLMEHGRRHTFGSRTAEYPLSATVRIIDPQLYPQVLLSGTVGAGESYMEGHWDTDDLTALVRILLRNREVLDGVDEGWVHLATPARRLFSWLRRGTRNRARRNIAEHYDLGNSFFQLFLDPTLMYSSAIFERADMSLEEAQKLRLERICRKLDLEAGEHLLEIGTGWGEMAIHAARNYGCRVTTTTISQQQYALARERIAAAGLQDRVEVLLDDYRDLTGQYDKLVSIEMIEAVGPQFYDEYFAQCGRLLKTDGLMLLQAITIADQRYEAARRSVDFIQRYIFPGSTIPSVTALLAAATRGSDLRLVHLEDIGPHYATTLHHWRQNFDRNRPAIGALGYSERFLRMWEFYFCYCEGGFLERAIGDAQMLLAKPGNRRAPLLGALDYA
jgi:cyclopropane-fatty-acyl-phospholipid synthase